MSVVRIGFGLVKFIAHNLSFRFYKLNFKLGDFFLKFQIIFSKVCVLIPMGKVLTGNELDET